MDETALTNVMALLENASKFSTIFYLLITLKVRKWKTATYVTYLGSMLQRRSKTTICGVKVVRLGLALFDLMVILILF